MEKSIIRGMWIWNNSLEEAGVKQVVNRCREAGVKAIFPFTSTASCGDEYYDVTLPQLVEEAHAAGIEVHPWMDELRAGCYEKGRTLLQVLDNGKRVTDDEDVVCPANPLVRRHNVSEAVRLVSQYNVDGITLEDRLIFSSRRRKEGFRSACYCAYCQKNAPIEKPDWQDWKRARITQLVAELSEAVRRVSPQAVISMACLTPYDYSFYKGHSEKECRLLKEWDEYSGARHGHCVEWADWLKKGYLDFACPMIYSREEDMGCFRLNVKEVADIMSRAGRPAYIGLGFEWSRGHNSPETIRKQIRICRETGLPGIIIYSWRGVTDEHWNVLGEETES